MGDMKTIRYSSDAAKTLRKHRAQAASIIAKIERYAETGAGDAKRLVGAPLSRLRVGEFRVIFTESEDEISVVAIGPRGSVYD